MVALAKNDKPKNLNYKGANSQAGAACDGEDKSFFSLFFTLLAFCKYSSFSEKKR